MDLGKKEQKGQVCLQDAHSCLFQDYYGDQAMVCSREDLYVFTLGDSDGRCWTCQHAVPGATSRRFACQKSALLRHSRRFLKTSHIQLLPSAPLYECIIWCVCSGSSRSTPMAACQLWWTMHMAMRQCGRLVSTVPVSFVGTVVSVASHCRSMHASRLAAQGPSCSTSVSSMPRQCYQR